MKQAAKGDGSVAFKIKIPAKLCDLKFHEVVVKESKSGLQLLGARLAAQLIGPVGVRELREGNTFIDKDDSTFESELRRLMKEESYTSDDIQLFRDFRQDGYVHLKGAIEESTIDSVNKDIEFSWRDRPAIRTQSAGEAPREISSVDDEKAYRAKSARYLDFHNTSEATSKILCAPQVVRFIKAYLGAPIAGM